MDLQVQALRLEQSVTPPLPLLPMTLGSGANPSFASQEPASDSTAGIRSGRVT